MFDEEKDEAPKKLNTLALARDKLFVRQKAYINTFNNKSETDKAVLEDLARFCRANESTFDPDPRVHAVLEGRREVFLRIMDHVGLGSEELWMKYTTKKKREA